MNLNRSEFIPISAICIYGSKQPRKYEKSPHYYVERHPIEIHKNGKPVLRQGQPLEKEHLQAILQALSSNSRQTHSIGFIPNTVLTFSEKTAERKIIWYSPPKSQTLIFKSPEFRKSGQACCPGLIFALTGKTLMVFAFKGSKRPALSTRLFNAPFTNTYSDGRICLGTVKIPVGPFNGIGEEITAYEKCFFHSEFNGHLSNRVILKDKSIKSLWSELFDSKAKFPSKVLTPNKAVFDVSKLFRLLEV